MLVEIMETDSFVQIKISKMSEEFIKWVNESSDNLSGDIFVEYQKVGERSQEYMLGVHNLVKFLQSNSETIWNVTITISKLF